MLSRRNLLSITGLSTGALLVQGLALDSPARAATATRVPVPSGSFPVRYTDAEWRRMLTPMQYFILREGGTEPEHSGGMTKSIGNGVYACVGCGQILASSLTLFDAGIGYPNFWASPKGALDTLNDPNTPPPTKVVHCTRCGGHHGHLFYDGPRASKERFCLNGQALRFIAV